LHTCIWYSIIWHGKVLHHTVIKSQFVGLSFIDHASSPIPSLIMLGMSEYG
jgi:hypothetical protein